jgi:hypothetical protein
VGTRAVLDAVVKRKIHSPRQKLNPRSPIIIIIIITTTTTTTTKTTTTIIFPCLTPSDLLPSHPSV